MNSREDMIAEATDFGLKFKGNISNIKLAEMLAEYRGDPAPLDEIAPPGPAVKAEAKEVTAETTETVVVTSAQNLYQARRNKIAAAKKKAMATQIVTITNKDNRENDVMTTAYLAFENQHFGIAKNVPLDIPVQLEAALIDIAERCMMTMHKDEVVGGRRTGNKVSVRVKKYAISYGRTPE